MQSRRTFSSSHPIYLVVVGKRDAPTEHRGISLLDCFQLLGIAIHLTHVNARVNIVSAL